jgi:hypothetical protein
VRVLPATPAGFQYMASTPVMPAMKLPPRAVPRAPTGTNSSMAPAVPTRLPVPANAFIAESRTTRDAAAMSLNSLCLILILLQ